MCGAKPGTRVVFEAAYEWSWSAELLKNRDLEVQMAHPRVCKAIAHARLKNDRVDARTLAHLFRTDLLQEAWIAPRPVKELPISRLERQTKELAKPDPRSNALQ